MGQWVKVLVIPAWKRWKERLGLTGSSTDLESEHVCTDITRARMRALPHIQYMHT